MAHSPARSLSMNFLLSFPRIQLFFVATFLASLGALHLRPHAAHAQTTPAPAPETAAAAADEEDDSDDKYNAYVKAYNALNGMFYGSTKGMNDLLEKYKSQRLSARSGGGRDPIRYMNTSKLRNHAEALREGVAIKDVGPYAKLDEAARKMYANSAPLHKLSIEYEDYLDSKKYLDDDFAKGRAFDGPFIKGWEQLIRDHDVLGNEISVAERIQRVAAITAARKAGENLMAATREAMLTSSDLIDIFSQASDFGDAAKVKASEPLVAQLEKALKEIRERSQSESGDTYRHSLIADYMAQILGAYRSMKNARRASDSDFANMIEKYNSAVKQMDRINR
jgi:hypothetical protein